jgi:hypothetical protein
VNINLYALFTGIEWCFASLLNSADSAFYRVPSGAISHLVFQGKIMNKFARFVRSPRTAVAAALVAAVSAAHAEVPAGVTSALSSLSVDALTVAGVVLAAIVAVYAFKFLRKGL